MKSVYIHIPFCNEICSYCDFCKVYYNKNFVKKYLVSLEKEIKSKYKGEEIHTLYIGGGTPSVLSIEELKILFNIINKLNLSKKVEFTFECNIESTNYEKLKYLYDNGVNRLSFGVQTFNRKYLKFLNRNHTSDQVKKIIKEAKQIGFININVDLMYAFPNETLEELKKDIDELLKLNIPHISTYSLIIEEHTKLFIDGVKNISQDLDRNMYDLICKKLKKYPIWYNL